MRNNRRRGCDHKPRRQNGATETPQEPNTQKQQEGPQTWDQPIPLQEQVKDNRDRKRRNNYEGQPRLQTSQRTGAIDTAGQKRTHPKARESKQETAQLPQKSRTIGDDRTTNKVLEANRDKKHYYTRPNSHNPYGSSLTQGAEPSKPLQARRRSRITDNKREG